MHTCVYTYTDILLVTVDAPEKKTTNAHCQRSADFHVRAKLFEA